MWDKYVGDFWVIYIFGYLLDIYYWDYFLFLYELNEMIKFVLLCISFYLYLFLVENNCYLYVIILDIDFD